MGSRRPLAKSLAQDKRSEEHQEEQTQRVGDEDESLVRKQIPYPHQDEGEKAPRENQHPENAVSGGRDCARNENEREKDSGQKPERTNPSKRIKKKDIDQERDQQSGQRDIGCPQPFQIGQDASHFIRPPLMTAYPHGGWLS